MFELRKQGERHAIKELDPTLPEEDNAQITRERGRGFDRSPPPFIQQTTREKGRPLKS